MLASSRNGEIPEGAGRHAGLHGDTGGTSREGTILRDDYRVLQCLGAGGMGEVYEVEHLRLCRVFAAKFLRADLRSNLASVERFEAEARAMSRVRSGYVVEIVDSGTAPDGAPFFVMERLYGSDLRRLLNRHRTLSVPRAVALVLDAARGLRMVHAAGLVHGDVKPANLFVCSENGAPDCCKVLDFGLARSQAERTALRASGAGTVRYMAPEQLADGGVVDQRADLYAVGAVLYECLTGRPPHGGERVEHVIYSAMHERPTPPRELGIVLPGELEGVVLRALASDPDVRFPSAEQLVEALLPFAARRQVASIGSDDTTDELRDSWLPVAPRRSWLAWFAAGAVAGGAVVGTVELARPPARELVVSAPQKESPGAPTPALDRAASPAKRLVEPRSPPGASPASPREQTASPLSGVPARPSRPRTQESQPSRPRASALGVFDPTSPYEEDERAP